MTVVDAVNWLASREVVAVPATAANGCAVGAVKVSIVRVTMETMQLTMPVEVVIYWITNPAHHVDHVKKTVMSVIQKRQRSVMVRLMEISVVAVLIWILNQVIPAVPVG
jgi:alkylhydroperoxidase family enzyme